MEAKRVQVLCPPDQPFDIGRILEIIGRQAPKLVLLCSPDNPSGRECALEQIEAICRAAPGLVFLDEAYGEFSDQSALPLLHRYPSLIISRTFSKAFSMAGLRLGYFISSSANIEQLRKANLPYNINLFTERIALRLLEERYMMEEQVALIKRERDWLLERDGSKSRA